MLNNQTITFLGAGSMAEAIIGGLVRQKIVKPSQIIATNLCDHERLQFLKRAYGIKINANRQQAVETGDIVILAMKPKSVKEALEDMRGHTNEKQLFISVLAGISTAYIEELLMHRAAVIRTMPNTSAKVGASATGISSGQYATESQLLLASTLFESIGTVTPVPEEKLDAVTGLAGSGPAYFYYIIEAMEVAARKAGLTEYEAKALITQTVVGVGKRLQTTTKSAQELYLEVMSPNGTTEAGLRLLEDRDSQSAVSDAIAAAIRRSKELGKTFSETN